MKHFFIDTGLLVATVCTIPTSSLIHYFFLTITSVKYAVDIAQYVEKKISKKKKDETEG